MEAQPKHWLPLTEYALRSGMSISTLRRKIKSNTIAYKMEDGRYLIQSDDLFDGSREPGFSSSDTPVKIPQSIPAARPSSPERISAAVVSPPVAQPALSMAPSAEVESLRAEIRRMREEDTLRWKALEARVSGLAKKLEFFSEQMAETKMLVKIFEEKMDSRAQ